MILAVLFRNIGNDLIPPVIAKIHIKIGHTHPFGVEEPFEQQVVFDGVDAGDADAVERLEKKLNGLKELQEKMKAANAYYRKNKTLDDCPALTQEQIDSLKEKMQKDWHYEDKPFATYQLSNNNAEIHRIEGRLKKLRAAKTEGNIESENEYFRIVENTEIMRLQLFFDGKPEAEVRDILKKNGFRWSRKNNCWQRQLTDNARYSLERVKKELEELK